MNQQISQEILNKHAVAIKAARNYWVLNLPTGMLDKDFNKLEALAREDGLELRDYVYQEIQGTRVQNADYLTKVKKSQVDGSMKVAIKEFSENFFKQFGYYPYWIPKYDGSSLIGYYDTITGECKRVVTVGGMNLTSEGIDQTSKFKKYFPKLSNTGIRALQCECLVKLEHGFGEKSRQKANGLVNSKFLESEIEMYCNLRCFRYFLDPDCPYTSDTNKYTYQSIMSQLPKYQSLTGDIKFSGGFVMTTEELMNFNQIEKDIWLTDTGTFLVDGIVAYTKDGECIQALKYKDAGRGETTKVTEIRWNDKSKSGKDSWSANAIIEPIELRGSRVTKPTVGSVSKMVENKLSPGAQVTVILANSTIPQVKDVIEPGNEDYNWPTCSCGYKMSEKDVFGALLKCGNPNCTNRLNNMREYLQIINAKTNWYSIDLNKLLILDRFDWHKILSEDDYNKLLENLWHSLQKDDFNSFKELLKIKKETAKTNKKTGEIIKKEVDVLTELQLRNLDLVINPAWTSLKEIVINYEGPCQ